MDIGGFMIRRSLRNVTDEALFLLSCTGIFSAFVFGLYQDHPPAGLKILGVIAAFSALAGIAAG